MIKRLARKFRAHRYGLTLIAYLTAAFASGVVCVAFMRGFDLAVVHRLDFLNAGSWIWVTTPLCFLLCVVMIRYGAPEAEGTGIPQAVFAAKHGLAGKEKAIAPITSAKTFVVKALSLLLGVWACASTGREGPSVHLSVCVFVAVMVVFRRLTGLTFDLRSAVVAGGSAGLAAAFNTPLAGVTFAIEEMSAGYFDSIKEVVLLAIIFAAVAAQSFTGEYSYFGMLAKSAGIPLLLVVVIGVAGGALGAFFSTSILKGGDFFARLRRRRAGLLVPVILGLAIVLLGALDGPRVFGPGNNVASDLLSGEWNTSLLIFPFTKLASTLLTYCAGLAGGIFAPCLAMGAAMGANIAQFAGLSTGAAAIIGMAALLSGTIQAPVTSFVIIFEMTGDHRMLLPVMMAAMIAFIVARLLGAAHLYQSLAERYAYLLAAPAPAASLKPAGSST